MRDMREDKQRSQARRAVRQPRCAGSTAALASLAALLAVSLLLGCGHGNERSLLVTSGHIEATDIRVSSKVGGLLLTFPHDEGDHLKQGEVIARIDTVDVALLLAGARADREQAAADLRLRLAGSRQEDIAEAKAQVARAQAELEAAESDLSRMQRLLDAGSGTTKARDDARTRRDVASAALDAAREQWLRRQRGSRPEEIDAARARLQAADSRVAQLAQQVRDATVTSPADGVMTEKLAQVGELLSPGAGLCVLTDVGHPWLTVYVGEPDLGQIRLGQEAEVVDDSGQRRTGRITFIAQDAEFTPKNVQTREERVKLVFKVKISLDNTDGLFKPGMPAEARLRAAASAS
jgi:HlyD family secretion protein